MKTCMNCIMPNTKPNITFKDGVCNACINTKVKEKVNWKKRKSELIKLTEETKKKKPKGYNCLIPVSGGKDSMFLALTAKDLGLNPLCIYVEPCYITERGDKNIRNLSKLGFDIFRFMPNQKIMPKLLKKSFIEDGQPVGAFEFMLYSVPMQVAINYKIPLVIWGEDSAFEYGNIGEDTKGSASKQKDYSAINGRDAKELCNGLITENDLLSFQHPTKKELEKARVKSIFLSYYVNWNSRVTADFALKQGLTIRTPDELEGTGGYWDFEQLDDEIPIISHLMKYIKFGFGRATDQACRDIRNGHITREEGLKLAKKYDGKCNPEYIRRYCDYIGITVREFWDITEKWKK